MQENVRAEEDRESSSGVAADVLRAQGGSCTLLQVLQASLSGASVCKMRCDALSDTCSPFPFVQWNGHEGYKKAEVTGGGVPLSQVSVLCRLFHTPSTN